MTQIPAAAEIAVISVWEAHCNMQTLPKKSHRQYCKSKHFSSCNRTMNTFDFCFFGGTFTFAGGSFWGVTKGAVDGGAMLPLLKEGLRQWVGASGVAPWESKGSVELCSLSTFLSPFCETSWPLTSNAKRRAWKGHSSIRWKVTPLS